MSSCYDMSSCDDISSCHDCHDTTSCHDMLSCHDMSRCHDMSSLHDMSSCQAFPPTFCAICFCHCPVLYFLFLPNCPAHLCSFLALRKCSRTQCNFMFLFYLRTHVLSLTLPLVTALGIIVSILPRVAEFEMGGVQAIPPDADFSIINVDFSFQNLRNFIPWTSRQFFVKENVKEHFLYQTGVADTEKRTPEANVRYFSLFQKIVLIQNSDFSNKKQAPPK